MTDTAEKLKTQLFHLSGQERAELAHLLIQSLDEDVDADADDDIFLEATLAQRVEDIKSGKAVGESADTVFSELRKKYL